MPYVIDAIRLGKRSYTSEGYLVAPAVIAKAGVLRYQARELELKDRSPGSWVNVYRSAETLTQAAPSFENKPITLDHPPEGVSASSWKALAVGDVHDVATENDDMHATIFVRDKSAIDAINGGKRQLSNGYTFDLNPVRAEKYEFEQVNIQGNHLAIVDRARCGPTCIVGDREPLTSLTYHANYKKENNMVRLMMDGYPPEVDENTAAIIVTKLQKEIRDVQERAGKDMEALRIELSRPNKLKIGDAFYDAPAILELIESRDRQIKELQAQVMTPEKAREELRQQHRLAATVKDMLPKMQIGDPIDTRTLCLNALHQLADASPAAKAQIAAVLDGVMMDEASNDSLARAVRTVHAAHQAAKSQEDRDNRNSAMGRAVFNGQALDGMTDPARLSGRDSYVYRLEHLMESGEAGAEEL